MTRTHKHKGVERSDGSLRSHPADRAHKDPKTKRFHTMEVLAFNKAKPKIKPKSKPKAKPKAKPKLEQVSSEPFPKQEVKGLMVPMDDDGFLMIDLTQYSFKGLRVKFQRREGRKRRTIGVEIRK